LIPHKPIIKTLHKPTSYLFFFFFFFFVRSFYEYFKPKSNQLSFKFLYFVVSNLLWKFFNEFIQWINAGEVEERTRRKGAQKERKGGGSPLHYYKGSLLLISNLLFRIEYCLFLYIYAVGHLIKLYLDITW